MPNIDPKRLNKVRFVKGTMKLPLFDANGKRTGFVAPAPGDTVSVTVEMVNDFPQCFEKEVAKDAQAMVKAARMTPDERAAAEVAAEEADESGKSKKKAS